MSFHFINPIKQIAGLKRKLNIARKIMSSGIVLANYLECDLFVRVSEEVGKSILAGEFEIDDIKYFEKNISHNDVILDIGANVGVYCVTSGKRNADARIIAFEPIPINAQLIRASLLLNHIENVQVIQKCVSDSTREVLFSVSIDSAYSSMIDTRRKPEREAIKCQAVKLEDFCVKHGINQIDLIKIDVEGAEELVIRGGEKIFGNSSVAPRLVLMELYDQNLKVFGSSIEKVLEMMGNYGYTAFTLIKGTKVVFKKKYYNKHYNVFFEKPRN